MRFIKRSNLEDRASKYPDVQQVLADWVAMVRVAAWESPDHLVNSSKYPARTIGNGRVIFNIKGNDYRLICAVHYVKQGSLAPGRVFFKFFGTHADYDKIDATTVEP
jgi:mRNA interferase HigB